jgi:hypothetical protein
MRRLFLGVAAAGSALSLSACPKPAMPGGAPAPRERAVGARGFPETCRIRRGAAAEGRVYDSWRELVRSGELSYVEYDPDAPEPEPEESGEDDGLTEAEARGVACQGPCARGEAALVTTGSSREREQRLVIPLSPGGAAVFGPFGAPETDAADDCSRQSLALLAAGDPVHLRLTTSRYEDSCERGEPAEIESVTQTDYFFDRSSRGQLLRLEQEGRAEDLAEISLQGQALAIRGERCEFSGSLREAAPAPPAER